jgi:uncharacterized protein YecT (DUF1311 family)
MKTLFLGLALVLCGATAAQAIDCTKTATDLDHAICSSPDLLKADDTMSSAYEAAFKAVGPKMAKVLKADQAAWNDARMSWCIYDADGNDATPEGMAACLTSNTELRRKFLSGEPLEGPGIDQALIPQALIGVDQITNEYLRFATPAGPGPIAFNAWLDKRLKDIRMSTTDDHMSDSFMLTLAYLSPTLLSAVVDIDLEDGYAHPMVTNSVINIDMATGKPLTMEQLLDTGALANIQDECLVQMKDYIAVGENGDDVRRQQLVDTITELDHWSFGSKDATIRYIEYGMDDPMTCTIGYDMLRPIAKPSFPLPA